jgi:NAD dependent epimerase/dehydratase family enzyme
MSSELLNNARVLPARLLAAGFRFEYPTLGAALAAELHADPQVNVAPSRSGTRGT